MRVAVALGVAVALLPAVGRGAGAGGGHVAGCGTPLGPIQGPLPVGTGPCPGVRPGAAVWTGVGGCSFNFVFHGSDQSTYIGTAGHCILKDWGERVWAPGEGPSAWDDPGNLVGEFAYAVQRGERDFALIRVAPGVPVDPAMCHFGGPTGLYTDLDPSPVLLRHYGQGYSVSEVVPGRSGIARDTLDPDFFWFWGLAFFGDSGSGVMTANGEAAAVLVRLGAGLNGITGATRLPLQIERAEARLGIAIELVTAPLREEVL